MEVIYNTVKLKYEEIRTTYFCVNVPLVMITLITIKDK